MIEVPATRRTTADRQIHPIQSDHRALGASAERLDRLLGGFAAGTRSPGSEVRLLLEDFRRLLLTHLDAEEQSGVLERAAAAEPRFARRIGQLLREHQDLRQAVHALAAGPDARMDWAGFHARFVTFRATLDLHEQAENDILHRAFLEDIGGGD